MGTWIIGAAVVIIVGLAVYSIFRDRQRGKGCGCCESCTKCSGSSTVR